MKLPSIAKIIEIVRIFRPEFFNKATWFLLISGVALTSASVTEKILFALLDIQFHMKLTESSDSYVGLALILFGLAYNLTGQALRLQHERMLNTATQSADANDRKAHDLTILENLFAVLPYESVSPIINDASMIGLPVTTCDLISVIAHTHNTPPHELHNIAIEEQRRNLVSTCAAFYEATLQFLSHEDGHPDHMVVPPYQLKSRDRDAFYSMQRKVSSTGLAFLAAYEALIRVCKTENYYRVKIALV